MGKEHETIRDMIRESRPDKQADIEERAGEDTFPCALPPLAEQMSRSGKEGKQAALVIFDGMNMGNHIPLDDRLVVIGRDDECDIVIDDAGISRRHAKIQVVERGKLAVYDLGSTNGTYVQGKRVNTATIRPGGKILFGQRTMAKFVLEDQLDRLYQQELWSSCTRDGLTGIANRNYLKKRTVEAESFARRHHLPFTLLLFRVDNIEEINRTYGMQTGDQILVMLVQIISDEIRKEDVFSRFGGDILAILAIGMNASGGRSLAERICRRVSISKARAPNENRDAVYASVTSGVVTVDRTDLTEAGEVFETAARNLGKAGANASRQIVATEIL
jgi:two-component system cell cycle response regulator